MDSKRTIRPHKRPKSVHLGRLPPPLTQICTPPPQETVQSFFLLWAGTSLGGFQFDLLDPQHPTFQVVCHLPIIAPVLINVSYQGVLRPGFTQVSPLCCPAATTFSKSRGGHLRFGRVTGIQGPFLMRYCSAWLDPP